MLQGGLVDEAGKRAFEIALTLLSQGRPTPGSRSCLRNLELGELLAQLQAQLLSCPPIFDPGQLSFT